MFTGREIKLGTIFNIDITLDYSWFWIFFLITWIFGSYLLPSLSPGRSIFEYIIYAFLGSLLFFTSILMHEMSHTLVAKSEKLKIRKITLFIFGGVSDLTQEPPLPSTEFKIAVAGPFSSLVIGIVFIMIGGIPILFVQGSSLFFSLILYIGYVNVILAFFNLLPGFPLDGGRILRSYLWWRNDDLLKATRQASLAGQIIAYLLIFIGILELIVAGLLGGIWLILVGLFLNQMAMSSYVQTLSYVILKDNKIKDIMSYDLPTIKPRSTLNEFSKEALKKHHNYFAVSEKGKFIGYLDINILKRIPENEWDKDIENYIIHLENMSKIKSEDSAIRFLEIMKKGEGKVAAVMRNNIFYGLVSHEDLEYFLSLKIKNV